MKKTESTQRRQVVSFKKKKITLSKREGRSVTKWAGPDKNKCFRLRLAPSKVTPSGKERVGNKWFGCFGLFLTPHL